MPNVRIPQLARFHETIASKTTGLPLQSVNVEIRKQGATVDGAQSGVSPLVVAINDQGNVANGDSVVINATGTEVATVSAVGTDAMTLSGFADTLVLADDDRITVTRQTPSSDPPTLYNDSQRTEADTIANPLITDANGEVACWIVQGFYDILVSGGAITTPRLMQDVYITSGVVEFDVTDARYGAKFDKLNDDGPAIQKAIDEADIAFASSVDAQGAYVVMPKGTALTNQKISNKNRVSVKGQGKRNTYVQAGSGFPAGTVVVDWPAGAIFDSRWEDCTIDGNNVAGSIGVAMADWEEGSGLRSVSITNCVDTLLKLSGGQNYECFDLELFAGTNTTCKVIHSTATSSSRNAFHGISIATATQNSVAAITLEGTALLTFYDLHIEGHDIGFNLNGGSLIVFNFEGNANVTTAIQINGDASYTPTLALYHFSNAGTNFIDDNRPNPIPAGGTGLSSSASPNNVIPLFILSTHGPSQQRKALMQMRSGLTADDNSQIQNPWKFNRMGAGMGTLLLTGDLATTNANWGTTSTFTIVANSYDMAGAVDVTAGGSGIAADAAMTLTFGDGTFQVVPKFFLALGMSVFPGPSPVSILVDEVNSDATKLIMVFHGIPVAGQTYRLYWNCVGA